jgi:membrane-bound lytic murein transglycosylase B
MFQRTIKTYLIACFCLVLISNSSLAVEHATRQDITEKLMDELVIEHGFDEQYIKSIFGKVNYLPNLIDSISKPAEKTKTWPEYRAIFITPARIAAGVVFATKHQTLLNRASKETGVPISVLLGILGVETSFGRIMGRYKVIDSLYTLTVGYPPRSEFFRQQLINLFYLVREQNIAIETVRGSYAGAMGAPQFIPSSYRNFAIDGDGDGLIDLFENWDDIVMSVANYLKVNGWQIQQDIFSEATLSDLSKKKYASKGLKPKFTVAELKQNGLNFNTTLHGESPAQIIQLEGNNITETYIGFHNFFVITTYNRNVMYALSVILLGQNIQSAVN